MGERPWIDSKKGPVDGETGEITTKKLLGAIRWLAEETGYMCSLIRTYLALLETSSRPNDADIEKLYEIFDNLFKASVKIVDIADELYKLALGSIQR